MEKNRKIVAGNAGFTLIEIIAVLIILGILSAIAVPKFLDLATNSKVKTSLAIKGDLKSAMNMAFGNHRLADLTGTGATAGSDQYITNCASLSAYLDGASYPTGTSCATGTVTFPDGTTATITAETNTTPAKF